MRNVNRMGLIQHIEVHQHPLDRGEAVPHICQRAGLHIDHDIVPAVGIGNQIHSCGVVVIDAGRIICITEKLIAFTVGLVIVCAPCQRDVGLVSVQATIDKNSVPNLVLCVRGFVIIDKIRDNPRCHIICRSIISIRHQSQVAGALEIHSFHLCFRACKLGDRSKPIVNRVLFIAPIHSIISADHIHCTRKVRCGHAAAVSTATAVGNIASIAGVGILKEHTVIQIVVDLDRPADGILGIDIPLQTSTADIVSGGYIADCSPDRHGDHRHDHSQYQQRCQNSAANAKLFHRFHSPFGSCQKPLRPQRRSYYVIRCPDRGSIC